MKCSTKSIKERRGREGGAASNPLSPSAMEFLSPIVHSALLRVETYLRSSPFASFLPHAPEVPEIFIPTRTIPLPELVTPCPTTPIVQVAHVTGFPLFLTAALTFVLLASAFGLGLFVVVSPALVALSSALV